MIHNQAIDNILARTSVRKFTDEPVTDEELETMLRAAMASPTSMSYEPWHFVVIKDNSAKAKLRQALPFAKMISDSCLGIVVCGDESLYERVSAITGEDNTLYWVQDCSAASQNILLAAHSLGLGAVWTGIYPLKSRIDLLSNMLALPKNIVPLNLIVVGRPQSVPNPQDKWDKDKIHYDKF